MQQEKIQRASSYLLIFTCILYFFKVAFWPLTYIFIGSYVGFLLLFFAQNYHNFPVKDFFVAVHLPLILTGVFVLESLVDGSLISRTVFQKDLFLVIVLFSLFYFLFRSKVYLKQINAFELSLKIIVIIATFLGILNILKNIFQERLPNDVLLKLNISSGNTLSADYNYYCLFILFGWFILFYHFRKKFSERIFSKFIFIFLNLILLFNIVISGSRRGILVFLALVIFLMIDPIRSKKIRFDFSMARSWPRIIITIMLSGIILLPVVFGLSKEKISIMVFRYSTFAGMNDYSELYKKLWAPQIKNISEPVDTLYIFPEYWRSLNHNMTLKQVKRDQLAGVKISVKNRDSTEMKVYYTKNNNTYLANHTYKITFKMKFISGDVNSINAGWWSDDGNLGKVFLNSLNKKITQLDDGWYEYTSEYTFIDNHTGIVLVLNDIEDESEFFISDFKIIDKDYSQTFDTLRFKTLSVPEILDYINKINPPVNSGLNLINNGDFKDSLKYWYSSANELSIERCSNDTMNYISLKRNDGDQEYFSLYYIGRAIEFYENNEYQLSFDMKTVYPDRIPFQIGYWVDEGNGYQINLKPEVDTLSNGWLHVSVNYKFKYNQKNIVFPINSQIDNSLFYISNIELINLTRQQLQPAVLSASVEKKKAEFVLSSRIKRWLYSFEVWRSEYKWYQKLFGGGFVYYDLFTNKFGNGVTIDYPHNPLLSILLYSGIAGLILYLFSILRIFQLYIIMKGKYFVLLICFIMTYSFSFFSATHPFDPPIMGFFMILPFYLHYFYIKDR